MENLSFYFAIAIIFISIAIFLLPKPKKSPSPQPDPQPEQEKKPAEPKQEPHKLSQKEIKKLAAQSEKQQKAKKKITNPDHPFFKNSFKGFGDEITDFTFSQNYLAIACKDKSFKLFKLKQIEEENPYFYLNKLDINYPTCISFNSSNEKFLACGLSADKTIELFEFKENEGNKKYFHSYKKFPTNIHKEEVKNVYFVNNSCIATFGGGSDTTIKIWNSHCEQLSNVDTKQMKHHFSTISKSNKFLFVGSWCPDIKVFEIKLDKNDKSFKNFSKIMDLGLHKTEIVYISCSENEDKVLTISKDKTVRFWNINVEYEKKGDPKCIHMIDMKKNEYFGENCSITAGDIYSRNDGQGIIALAEQNSVALINLTDFKLIEKINNAHSEDNVIEKLKFHIIEKEPYLFSYGNLDKRINVFKI